MSIIGAYSMSLWLAIAKVQSVQYCWRDWIPSLGRFCLDNFGRLWKMLSAVALLLVDIADEGYEQPQSGHLSADHHTEQIHTIANS